VMHVKVKVTAGAKKEKFISLGNDSFTIYVKEKALHNMANRRVRELLAGHFGVSRRKVRMVKGHRSSHKLFNIQT